MGGVDFTLVWISRKGKRELIVNVSMRSAHNATNSFYPWHRPSSQVSASFHRGEVLFNRGLLFNGGAPLHI